MSANQEYFSERMDFVLPEFVRLSWVSEQARTIWAPRFKRVVEAWATMEQASVVSAIRSCALVIVSSNQLDGLMKQWEAWGLTAVDLEEKSVSASALVEWGSRSLRVVLGNPASVRCFREAWGAENHGSMGELLGYPECCRNRFEERCISGKSIDPTWPMAIESSHCSSLMGQIEIRGDVFANALWRWVGVRAVPHLPCRFDCAATVRLGRRFLDLGIKLGFRDEVEWLREILSWPVAWSGLHGIAEVKTPLLKICTRTDAMTFKQTLRLKGESYPKEGAQGVAFPYRQPLKPKVTSSLAFERGLEQNRQDPLVGLNAAVLHVSSLNTRSQ